MPQVAAFAAVGALLTLVGFEHGKAIGIARAPPVVCAYAVVAGVGLWCAKAEPPSAADESVRDMHGATAT